MRVTIDDLKAAGATCSGLDWFREFFGDDTAEREWTYELQMEVVRSEGRRWLGWAVRRRIVPLWSMSGANLSGANLVEANLRRADLTGANLREADLTGANLREADLVEANLVEANLTGANLREANLRRAVSDHYTRWPEGFTPAS